MAEILEKRGRGRPRKVELKLQTENRNTSDFEGQKIDYINSLSEEEKSKILDEFLNPKKYPVVSLDENKIEGHYVAYAILPKPKTGGLYILRKLFISDGKILYHEDNVEDMFSVQAAKLEQEMLPK